MKTQLAKIMVSAVATLTLLMGCSSPAGTTDAGDETGNLRVWFMQNSISDDGQKWLVDEFAKQHPGSTLEIETQQWDGIVAKLQTSLASPDQTPDVVEFGNTKVGTFANVGALADLTDMYDKLGGEDLIQSFIGAGTVDGKRYAYPLYAGVRVIYYRKDLFEQAGVRAPTTLAELNDVAKRVQATNTGGRRDFKAIYLPAAETHALEGWLFTHGANYAAKDGDTWAGTLTSPESQAALTQLQELWSDSSLGTFDSSDARRSPWVPYNNSEVAMFTGLPFVESELSPAMKKVTGVFALPPATAGGVGRSFSGGSSIGISAGSAHPNLAKDALELIYSDTFQTKLATDLGWTPGNTRYASALPDGLVPAKLQVDIARNSVLTPPAENWAIVESDNVPADMYAAIARGGSVATIAEQTDAKIEKVLNG